MVIDEFAAVISLPRAFTARPMRAEAGSQRGLRSDAQVQSALHTDNVAKKLDLLVIDLDLSPARLLANESGQQARLDVKKTCIS